MAKTKSASGKKAATKKSSTKKTTSARKNSGATKKQASKSKAAKKPVVHAKTKAKARPAKPTKPARPEKARPAKTSPAKTSPAKTTKPATTAKAATSNVTTTNARPAQAAPPHPPMAPTPAELEAFSFSDADIDSLVFEAAPDKPDATAFAPGTLVEHKGGTYSVVYSKFPESPELAAVYDERGLQGGGYTWHGFVVHLLQKHAPEALPALEFDPEGSMFCAVSKDLSALRAVGAALAQLENIELVKELAQTVDVSEYD